MLEFRPENFRHACESGDDEAQLYAFWAHSRTGLTAAREGDEATVDSCRRALLAMTDFFEGTPIAMKALLAIQRMDDALAEKLGRPAVADKWRFQANDGGESA
jgi:hypothetical protein